MRCALREMAGWLDGERSGMGGVVRRGGEGGVSVGGVLPVAGWVMLVAGREGRASAAGVEVDHPTLFCVSVKGVCTVRAKLARSHIVSERLSGGWTGR